MLICERSTGAYFSMTGHGNSLSSATTSGITSGKPQDGKRYLLSLLPRAVSVFFLYHILYHADLKCLPIAYETCLNSLETLNDMVFERIHWLSTAEDITLPVDFGFDKVRE